jgi:hypothetical protein
VWLVALPLALLLLGGPGVSACGGRTPLLLPGDTPQRDASSSDVAPPPDASSPPEAGVDAYVSPPCPGQSDGVITLATVDPSFSPAIENQAIAAADGYVYWVANGDTTGTTMGAVFRVPRCGGPVTVLASDQIDPVTVAVSGGYVYWTTTGDHNTGTAIGTLMREPVAGGPLTQLATGPAVFSYYFTVDSEYVYSTAFDANFGAWREPLSGGPMQDLSPNNQWIFHTIVVDAARAYMTAPGTAVNYLVSIPIGGGDADILLMNKIPFPGLLVEDEQYLYFPTTDNTLERLNKDGSSPLTLASNLAPTALAVDGQSAYVSMNGGGSSDGIYAIPAAGGAMTTLSTKGGVALAVDDYYAYWLDYQSHVYRVRK